MTVVFDTSIAQAVGEVTATRYDNTTYAVLGSPVVTTAAVDGSWSLELSPTTNNDYWGVAVFQQDAEPQEWYLFVPEEGPINVRQCPTAAIFAGGTGVTQIFAGNGISLEPADGTGQVIITNTGAGGGLPVYSGTVGVSITDNSDTGISIREESGGGTLDIFSQGEVNITSESAFILNSGSFTAGLGGPTQIIVDSGDSNWPLTIANQNTGGINIDAGGGGIGISESGGGGINIYDSGGGGISIGEGDSSATQGVVIYNAADSTSILIATTNQNPVQITTDDGSSYANLYNSDTVADLPNPPTAQPAFGFSGQGTFNWYDGTQWRAPVGVTQLRNFAFDYTTPNLNTGVALYTPQNGEVLLDAWIQVSNVWDGTTPTADFGMLLTPNEGLLAVLTTLSSSNRLQDMTVGAVTQYGLTYDGGTANNLANASSWADVALVPSFFSSTDPFCVVVSTDGTVSGGATGSTTGSAVLFLLTGLPQ